MAEPKTNEFMEKIVSLCKRRGFIFQSSEIYGGINGFWDYGPLGAELKRNVKDAWWRRMVYHRDDVAGLEATIIMHPQIWKASGHVDTFSDPMVDCLGCNKRFRADQVDPQSGTAFQYRGAGGALTAAILRVKEALSKKDDFASYKLYDEYKSACATESVAAAADLIDFIGRSNALLDNSLQCHDTFSVIIPDGKPPDSARKRAVEFYRLRKVPSPVLVGERTERIVSSTSHCPECGSLLTAPQQFNLMFKTYVGPVADEDNVAYLRPETAQAIFAQFKNVLETSRQKVPFGIAQVGKAFRNEVTPRNYTFRSREFEQMELEFFIRPDEAVEAIAGRVAKAEEALGVPPSDGNGPAEAGTPNSPQLSTLNPQPAWGWEAWHKYWVEERINFYENIGLPRNSLVEYWQKPEELAHYARATVDILYKFPFSKRNEQGELMGEELEGIAARSDFDLSQHQRCSGKSMGVFDEELKAAWAKLDDAKKAELSERYFQARLKYLTKTGEALDKAERQAREDAAGLAKGNYIPHVIEPSAGVDRLILALICNAYAEDQAPDEKGKMESRIVMRFHPRIAPIKVAVFPLLKNRPELVAKAKEVRDLLRPHMTVFYDEAGAIGRRYRRQDEAGTPFGVTIDFDTLGEKGPDLQDTVTLRDRDTMKQERVKIDQLLPLLLPKVR